MKNQNLHSVDSFSTSRHSYASNNDAGNVKKDLDTGLIDLYAPDPTLAEIPKKDINISIKFSLPSDLLIEEKIKNGLLSVKKFIINLKNRKLRFNKRIAVFASAVILPATAFIIYSNFLNTSTISRPPEVKGASTTPKFTALAPGSSENLQQRYDNKREVISSSHNLNGIDIILSQQVLPEAFKHNPQNNVSDTAKRFNATKEITAGDTIAYAGKSADGPQTIIFHKNNILVFIYSPIELDNQTIASFIEDLK